MLSPYIEVFNKRNMVMNKLTLSILSASCLLFSSVNAYQTFDEMRRESEQRSNEAMDRFHADWERIDLHIEREDQKRLNQRGNQDKPLFGKPLR
jgi:hypothetical protein